MTDSLSPEELRECANNIRRLGCEVRNIEKEILNIWHEIDSCSQYINVEKFVIRLQNYLKETHDMCEAIDEYANEIKGVSLYWGSSCYQYCLPFFDFIVSFDIGAWWEQAYPVIAQIATVTGAVTGTAAITTAPFVFIKWVRSKLQEKREKDEYAWIRLILDEEEWSISLLSQKIDLSESEVKRILKGFGYKWNSQKMLYVSTESTQKLRNIDIHKASWD